MAPHRVPDRAGPNLDRAAGSRPIAGNALTHIADSPAALRAMLDLIGRAQRRILLENYIVRGDAIGRRFAEGLIERARAGVQIRLLYDAFGCRGTPASFWRRLRRGGVEVRGFGRFAPLHPFAFFTRNHRKLFVTDGATAVVGGLCIGEEWMGDAARGRLPWRDTALVVEGPAALALERSFLRSWSLPGEPAPEPASAPEGRSAGDMAIRLIEGVPGSGRMWRVAQLLCDGARNRIWITDAYLVMPPLILQALLDAARAGVDVRILVPGASDAPLVRDLTRESYRVLLAAGVRIFEWAGPMLHAKTMVVDDHWGRIGSTNLNARSLYGNYELDLLLETPVLVETMAAQFRHDLAGSTEIVAQLRARRKPRLVTPEAPGTPEHRPSLHERRVRATMTMKRITWRMRRRLLAGGSALLLLSAVLLLLFPRAMGTAVAVATILVGLPLGVEALSVESPGRSQRAVTGEETDRTNRR